MKYFTCGCGLFSLNAGITSSVNLSMPFSRSYIKASTLLGDNSSEDVLDGSLAPKYSNPKFTRCASGWTQQLMKLLTAMASVNPDCFRPSK